MNTRDPNVQMLEMVAKELGDLCEDLVFVGGSAAGLLCTSPSAAPPRVTYDVDVVSEVTTLSEYHKLEKRLASRGFIHDTSPDAPVCRWRLGKLILDLMPSEKRVLGFANRWYPLAMATAVPVLMPNGMTIRLIAAPVFLATKFEAFSDRGRDDLMSSHDFEDIIHVLSGRDEIEVEIEQAVPELRSYLVSRFRQISSHPDFENTLPGLVAFDALHADRLVAIRQRIAKIVGLVVS